jgi:hypothetical protein
MARLDRLLANSNGGREFGWITAYPASCPPGACRDVRSEALDVVHHERGVRRDKGGQALLHSSDEQNAGDLRQFEIA